MELAKLLLDAKANIEAADETGGEPSLGLWVLGRVCFRGVFQGFWRVFVEVFWCVESLLRILESCNDQIEFQSLEVVLGFWILLFVVFALKFAGLL